MYHTYGKEEIYSSQEILGYIVWCVKRNYLMFAYLTDARLATVTRREGYVSWGV